VIGLAMRRCVAGLCLLLLPCGVACGGKSQVERDPSGGGASAGGGSNAAGATASAGAQGSVCPIAQPTELAPCNSVSGECAYIVDKCSSVTFECVNGAWFEAPRAVGQSYDCASFQSPNLPSDGDSCECFGKLDCTFDDCADRGVVHAVCDNTKWHVQESACPRQPCGPDLSCAASDLCVVHTYGAPTFTCESNECALASKRLGCDCAGSHCAKSERCSVDVNALVCSCTTCI
jgi:hypothetical protein